MNVFWTLMVAGILVMAQTMLFKRAGHKGIFVDRRFSQTRLFEGDRFELVETIENRRILPVPWLRIETRMPSEMLFGKQDNLEIGAQRYHRSVFFMGPWQRVTRTHQVRVMHRGYYTLASYAMTVGDLLGLSGATIERAMNRSLVVYPRLLSRRELSMPSSKWQGERIVKRFIDPDLFLYSGIRDYYPGDVPRDVHWRAYAKTGQLKVKQHDHTASTKLVVLLNTVSREQLWDTADDRDKALIERGISMAASLMCYAIEDGMEVGFGCNGYAKPFEESTVYLPPAGGAQQSELLLEVCARLVVKRVRPFHVYLGEMPMPRDCDVVIISGYVNELMQARINDMRAHGNTVSLMPISKEDVA